MKAGVGILPRPVGGNAAGEISSVADFPNLQIKEQIKYEDSDIFQMPVSRFPKSMSEIQMLSLFPGMLMLSSPFSFLSDPLCSALFGKSKHREMQIIALYFILD